MPDTVDASAGMYYGTIKLGSGLFASTVPFYGLIDSSGNGQFVEDTSSLFSTSYVVVAPAQIATASNDTFSVSYNAYGTTTSSGTMQATVSPGKSLSGTLVDSSGSSSETASFSLTYEASSWETGSAPDTIAGTYTGSFEVSGTTYEPTLVIYSNGTIVGTDSKNCTYAGAFYDPDINYNGYELSLGSSCIMNGSNQAVFAGVGAYFAKTLLSPAYFRCILNDGANGIVLTLQEEASSSSSSSSSGG